MNTNHTATANGELNLSGKLSLREQAVLIVSRIARRITHYRRCQRDLEHLMDLPDYLLEDVGLTRGDLVSSTRHGRIFGNLQR